MTVKTYKDIQKDIQEHPERYDFADCGGKALTPEQVAAFRADRPEWVKKYLVKPALET